MIWVDWCLLAAFAVSIMIGVLRGFTREVLGLASWVVALGAALLLAPGAAVHLEPHIATPSIRIAAAYGLVFIAGLLVGAVITALVSMLVRKSPLSGVDRMVGGGFGVVRGVLIAGIVVALVGLTPARQDPWWKESVFIGWLEPLADGFSTVLPDDWQQRIKPPPVAPSENA